MRLGQLQKAALRFLDSLEINPDYKTCQKNVKEIQGFMSEEDWLAVYSEWIEGKEGRSAIPSVTPAPPLQA